MVLVHSELVPSNDRQAWSHSVCLTPPGQHGSCRTVADRDQQLAAVRSDGLETDVNVRSRSNQELPYLRLHVRAQRYEEDVSKEAPD